MALSRLQPLRRLHRALQPLPQLPSCSKTSSSRPHSFLEGFGHRSIMTRQVVGPNASDSLLLQSIKVSELASRLISARLMSSMKAPPGARQVSLKVNMQSPGFIYEPYKLPEPIPFWRRWFTRSGWRRTKEDFIREMKSAYAITRLKKITKYSKKLFYQRAVVLYKEINTLMAKGDTSSLRKLVTDKMYSTLKNEIKKREAMWASVHWELVEPVTSLRTLRARMRFEAYNSSGAVVSGDKSKEVLVRDIWIFERSLYHPGADWRLCGRITL